MSTAYSHNRTDGLQSSPGSSREENLRGLATSLRKRLADARGQALSEFALVLPILLLVLFGILEFGLALNTDNDETHLANMVARYAIINENPGGTESLQNWAKKQGDSNFITSGGKICISFPEGEVVGKPVAVEATTTINWIPVLKLKKEGKPLVSSTLRGKADMRLETPPSRYKAGCST